MNHWGLRIRAGMGRLATAGRDLLFPPCCAHCGAELDRLERRRPFCPRCLPLLGPDCWQGCKRCGAQLPEDAPDAEDCPFCRNFSLRFDTVVVLGSYHAGLHEVVLRMKRPKDDALAAAMGQLLADRRREELAELRADVVVPIPMFWRRRLGRGVNSPETLAGCLARSLRIPSARRALERHRHTRPQMGLAPGQRFQNVRGAFRVRKPEAVRGTRVLLVDDVLTTGATCSEAARVLKQAGAAMVAVAVIARAQGH